MRQEIEDFLFECEKVYFPGTPWNLDTTANLTFTGLKLVLRVLLTQLPSEEDSTRESKWHTG